MQATKPRFIFLWILMFAGALHTRAQTAQESLGDPVLNETFGKGTNLTPIGPPLPEAVTTMQFVDDKCPGDGFYTIASSTSACFGDTWHSVYQDHTRTDPNGYMMIINASATPSVFYVQRVNGSTLCPGAKYQFSVWILNVLVASPITQGYIEPDITYTIETTSGQVLETYNTGPIAATSTLNWKQYAQTFNAPADGSDVIVRLRNNSSGGAGNDLILDDITVKPIGPVIDAGFGSTTGDAVKNICAGQNAAYHLKAFAHTYPHPAYQWQSNTNDAGWVNINGATSSGFDPPVISGAVVGKYQYRVGVLSSAGAALTCQTFSPPLTINVYPIPVYDLPPATYVCEGEILKLFGNHGDEYEWTGPNGYASTDQSPNVTVSANSSNAGVYHLTIKANGCSYTTSTNVIVYPPLVVSVDNETPVVCEGQSVSLQANGGTVYRWTPATGLDHDNIANPIARPTQTTEYQVSIGNGGCEKTRTVTVTVIKAPVTNAGKDITMQEGEPAKLNGTVTGDNASYYWTPADYLDDPTSLTPAANPPTDIIYTLHAVAPNNCGIVSDQVFVKVYQKLTIPSTFSPNNDGINDTWNIDKLITYPESILTVFARDGHQVYRTIGFAKEWNGVFEGRQLPAGVYYYTIDLHNNTPQKAGWVMLVR